MPTRDWKEEFFRIAPSSRLNIIDPEDFCEACGGSGYQTYGSTATWRGGVGGQSMTTDVCCECWGSGDKHRPWPSHRHAI